MCDSLIVVREVEGMLRSTAFTIESLFYRTTTVSQARIFGGVVTKY